MKQKILNFILILFIGGLGGVLANQFLFPCLASWPFFNRLAFIREAGQRTIIVNQTEKIIITENTALEEAIKKVSPSVVVIQSYQGKRLLKSGTGFILTGDGVVVTAGDLIFQKANRYLVIGANFSSIAQVQEKDLENNLALLKIDQTNLPIIFMANPADLDLGERIILIGAQIDNHQLNHFVNLGTIRTIEDSLLMINLTEGNSSANGGPLINIKGEVIGLNLIDQRGLVKTVPINKIKELLKGLGLNF